MKQVLVRQGSVVVEDVPAPTAGPGEILVQVERSCISVGTELSGIQASGTPLWRKALAKPDQVRRVVAMAREQGLARTRDFVKSRMPAADPTGYSAAGRVVGVAADVADVKVGDRVACAGAQCAHHAERIAVPRNLSVHVPDGLSLDAACTVTLGAIALQGVRRAVPTLGETFIVIGLGLLGQLTVQLLRANGCRVVGSDLDPARIAQARALGLDAVIGPDEPDPAEAVRRVSSGVGADGVIITAATPSSAVLATAFQMCRKKGRVVVVGDVGLEIDRQDIYAKELEFFISTSYGPGRYDRRYEEEGLDYPIGYVRWTENRNMEAYLRMLADGQVVVEPLVAGSYEIDEAPKAYAALRETEPRPLLVLLRYPEEDPSAAAFPLVRNPAAMPSQPGQIRLALIGAGAFAKGTHLPNIRALADRMHLYGVASRTGHNASQTASQFRAAVATTDYDRLLADPDADAVLVCTRHDQHAELALRALEAGKHVFVEKPTALREDELARILAFYGDGDDGKPILMTGYNRRFAPLVRALMAGLAERRGPLLIDYRMNAGYLPADHWVHGPDGGGRNLGEACHIYDLFVALTGARPVAVSADTARPSGGHYLANDNFVATVRFDDGSLAKLTYTAFGSRVFPKETMDVFCDDAVWSLHDYARLEVAGRREGGSTAKTVDKGHRAELEAFADAIRDGGPWPISLQEQADVLRIALRVQECIDRGHSEPESPLG